MAITAPKVVVTLDGATDEVTVQTDNRDAIQWDITRTRRDWPAGGDAPMLWMTFLAWHAMKRTGQTALELDPFLKACINVRTAEKPQPVDPTPSAADTD